MFPEAVARLWKVFVHWRVLGDYPTKVVAHHLAKDEQIVRKR